MIMLCNNDSCPRNRQCKRYISKGKGLRILFRTDERGNCDKYIPIKPVTRNLATGP